MKVLVIGTGAVGGFFGGRLARSGHQVTFVARGQHGARIREHGLQVEEPEGTFTARGAVVSDARDAAGLNADLVLVAVKSSALSQVARGAGAALAQGGLAIPLQNGLDSETELARAIGKQSVIGGVAQIAAELVEPGKVRVLAGGMLTIAACLAEQRERVHDLARELDASFPCAVDDDLRAVLYRKLLWNAPFNAVCALTRRSAGRVLEIVELERLVRDAMAEIVAVARAEEIDLGPESIDQMIAITRGVFASTEPSMLQDVRAGRETEADVIQGAVVQRGERHGIKTPIHRTLHALLKGLERQL